MNVYNKNSALLERLFDLEAGNASIEEVKKIGLSLIRSRLAEAGWSESIANSGLVARLIFSDLFKDEHISRWVSEMVRKGRMSKAHDSLIEAHAVERGLAALMGAIESAQGNDVPRKAAKALYKEIERFGHLPLPEDIRE